jgi:hypothetical protein
MATYNFERETRTPQSEAFIIESGGDEIGRVDLHYSGTTTMTPSKSSSARSTSAS